MRKLDGARIQKFFCRCCLRGFFDPQRPPLRRHPRVAAGTPRRDLWSSQDPAAEAALLFAACVASRTDFDLFAKSIEVNEGERRQFEFLESHRIVPSWKIEELVERRKKIRKEFEELVREQNKERAETKSPPN
jgi:hypothetical protein